MMHKEGQNDLIPLVHRIWLVQIRSTVSLERKGRGRVTGQLSIGSVGGRRGKVGWPFVSVLDGLTKRFVEKKTSSEGKG